MKNKKVWLSVLGVVGLVAVFWAVQYGNVGTQGFIKFDNLDSFQKQSYWQMMEKECIPLLNARGGSSKYRACALNVMKKASKMAPTSCVDSDGGAVYTESGMVTVKSGLYTSTAIKDYLYTFSSGKTYLMEGACSETNTYMYYQKNCKEINKYYDFSDKDYSQVKDLKYTDEGPDGGACFVYATANSFEEMLKDNWTKGYKAFKAHPYDNSAKGMALTKMIYSDDANAGFAENRFAASAYLSYLTNTDVKTYRIDHNITPSNWHEWVTVEEMLDLIEEASKK